MRSLFLVTALCAVLILAGCGEKFNAPFIDTVETLQLRPQMTMEEVITLCGDPLYVAFGDGEISVWVYEVRVLEVGGSSSLTDQALSGAAARLRMNESSGLVKQGNLNDHGEVVPERLKFFFKGDRLQFWATDSSLAEYGFSLYALGPFFGEELLQRSLETSR